MARIHAAVKAVIMDGGRFLVLRQRTAVGDFWDLPGGRMEHGESPLEALRREIVEETGLDVEIGEMLGVWWFFRVEEGDQVVCMTWRCRAKHTDIDMTKNPDVTELLSDERWVTKEEFLTDEYASAEETLRSLIADRL